ncbi:MAG TPA: hypothetical protein VF897_08925, partial [Roseiflexaceae bacterium]
MPSTTTTELDRPLQRWGDDLYRLALLLAPDARIAARALVAAARRMATGGDPPDEPALIAALVAALPTERKRSLPRRRPAWARPPARQASRAALLAALTRLPRQQRLALGLTMLRAFEPAQVAPLFGGDEDAGRAAIRDALLALAP